MTKIATWNVNSLKVRLPQVLDWLKQNPVDLLAIQETKLLDENFPQTDIEQAGYQVIYSGQKTYNGVAILTHKKLTDVTKAIPAFDDVQRRFLAATLDGIRIINLYVPNGEAVDSEKYVYKLHWLKQVNAYLKEQLKIHKQLVVLGDFNIAPENEDVYDPVAWAGGVLCSEPERAAFKELLKLGLHDSFRLFKQPAESYSWWDYRNAAFWRGWGLRIDHILISDVLVSHCKSCEIDKKPRKNERPSDHTPVIAVFKEK
jgi:exodeoxyribonuclease-3